MCKGDPSGVCRGNGGGRDVWESHVVPVMSSETG